MMVFITYKNKKDYDYDYDDDDYYDDDDWFYGTRGEWERENE